MGRTERRGEGSISAKYSFRTVLTIRRTVKRSIRYLGTRLGRQRAGDEVPTSARPNRPSGEDNLIGAIAARCTTARVTARSLGRRINNSVWRAFSAGRV